MPINQYSNSVCDPGAISLHVDELAAVVPSRYLNQGVPPDYVPLAFALVVVFEPADERTDNDQVAVLAESGCIDNARVAVLTESGRIDNAHVAVLSESGRMDNAYDAVHSQV